MLEWLPKEFYTRSAFAFQKAEALKSQKSTGLSFVLLHVFVACHQHRPHACTHTQMQRERGPALEQETLCDGILSLVDTLSTDRGV
jgi:hypothetical protein